MLRQTLAIPLRLIRPNASVFLRQKISVLVETRPQVERMKVLHRIRGR